jgi:MFS family permease
MNSSNLDILKEKNGIVIFISQLITSISDKMLSIGLIWYVTKNLGAEIVPWFLTCAFLPHLIFSFFSTKFIHRFGTIKTIMITEVFRGFVLLSYYFILASLILSKSQFTYSLFGMIFFIGIGSALFTPAILSSPPILVPENKIIGLNALIDTCMSISSILGAVASIFLLNFFDIRGLILINAITYFLAFGLQLFIKKIKSEVYDEEDRKISPFSVLKKYKEIAKMLLCFLLFNIVLTPIFVLIPWYVDRVYRGDSSSLATIEGAMGIGAFLMGIFISITKIEVVGKNRIKMIGVISFLFGIFFLLFSYSRQTWQGATILFFIGVASTFLNIQILTYFQTEASEGDVPAIMTSVNLISTASMPLSLVISGFIFPMVHVPTFAMVSGVVIIFMSLIIPSLITGDHQ